MTQVKYAENETYAFQINDIDFIVPPTSISVHKEGLNYSVKSLRTKSSVKIASGSGIYHAQINLTIPPEEFLSLHRLICEIKNNPFVYVRNNFLKDSLEKEEIYKSNNKHLFFTVMGLNINNHPGAPGTFIVELDLRYFNNKPYIENLGFNDDIEDGIFNIGIGRAKLKNIKTSKVTNPKDSKIYIRYCNWLQIEYLKKYFGLDPEVDIAQNISEEEERKLAEGELSLNRVKNKSKIIELLYRGSKYTVIRNRNFANLKLNEKLSDFLKKRLDTASKGKEGAEARNARYKALLEYKKDIDQGAKKSLPETGERIGSENFKTRTFKEIGRYPIWPPENEIVSFSDIIQSGEIEIVNQTNTTILIKVTAKVDFDYDKIMMGADRGSAESMFIFLPSSMTFKHYRHNTYNCGLYFSEGEGVTSRSATVFEVTWEKNQVFSFDKELAKIKKEKKNPFFPTGTLIGTVKDGSVFQVKISKNIFTELPLIKKKFLIDKQKEQKKGVNFFEEYKIVEKFISENYQPYMDRKFVSNSIFETIGDVAFLDYKNYELNAILGREGLEKVNEEGLDVSYDRNTVITGVNGSLRHITPTIPILGQETPTHQFLGSMEPSYQMSFIGMGSQGTDRMPDSFLLLEKNRKDSQINAKAFNEVPDAANFAINCLITKLLGSYENDYSEDIVIPYGGGEVRYLKEKFNFSINSMNTFTVEGQPNTYGLNIHFQESRSYKEEEIRPAFTNYDYSDDLSAEFFNEVLNSGIKILNSGGSKKKKSKPKKKRSEGNSNSYNWMKWTTKHITADEWYERPRGYHDTDKVRLHRRGRDISLPFETEMEKVKKYFFTNETDGNLWEESKLNDVWVKRGETSKNTKDLLDPDYCAYILCQTVSKIIDYFEILYPHVTIKLKLNSTLRLCSDKGYNATRGRHKNGTAVDIDFTGINQTEAGIYIYLMQLLGYLPDLTGQRRTNAYLGMGFYGKDAHKISTLMSPRDGHWLHLDLNGTVRKFIITDENEEFVFHVPSKWDSGLRCWYDDDYYFDGSAGDRPHIKNILGEMQRKSQIDSSKKGNKYLKQFGFSTMKKYRENLEAAHNQLIGASSAPEGKNLIDFWNTHLRPKLESDDSSEVDDSWRYNLGLPESCGANITIVDAVDGARKVINLKEEDNTKKDWYPASMIKLVAAIGCVYSLAERGIINKNNLEFIFTKLNGNEERRSFENLMNMLIKQSENVEFSLTVAIATRPYIMEWLEAMNSSIEIRYPMRFNKTNAQGKWVGEYTTQKNTWNGREDIKVVQDGNDLGEIKFKSNHGKVIRKRGSFCGTVADFSKVMIDYILRENLPFNYADDKFDDLEDPDIGTFYHLDECFATLKGHNQPADRSNSQNALRVAIEDKYTELGGTSVFTVYTKPGLYYYNRRNVGVTSDCIFFKNHDDSEDSFGITLWGERAADAIGEMSSRDHMISNNFHGNEEHMSLTELISYCIHYNAELKQYLES
jgi:hypothetical protein